MHPAPSVIAFTTLSGAGFGLLFFLGFDPTPPTGWTAFVFFLIAYGLAAGGLLASTLHLGHPERALKAFTQWRSSWLSREGWAAVATLVVMGLYAAGLVFFGWSLQPLGWLGGLLSLATIGTTAMIYTQLKTVPRWNDWSTPAMFFATGLAGGALLSGRVDMALFLLALAAAVMLIHWGRGQGALARSGTTIATATGLGNRGAVRAFEPPHTGTNYLLKEFVYVVGRKQAGALRVVGLTLGFAVPILALILPFGHLSAGVAVISHLVGVAATRWLFFAEAEHVVGLYYGQR